VARVAGRAVFNSLQIYDRRERLVVWLADVGLRMLAAPLHVWRKREDSRAPARVLVVRLERIGDLLMAFDALADLRSQLPAAHIDLVVGSWNTGLALAMGVADQVETLDAPWMVRGGVARSTWRQVVAHALGWRERRYDLAINFEPDIRSNLLLALSGARRRVGFFTGGGGAVLTHATPYEPTAHTRDNARRLVQVALTGYPADANTPQCLEPHPSPGLENAPGEPSDVTTRLGIPEAARDAARRILGAAWDSTCIGIHASGGRPIKQWHLDRFAEVATSLARSHDATIVLTGIEDDRTMVRAVRDAIPGDVRVVDVSGQPSLLELAAIIERLALLVTGDTGPMHLAAAVGTPVVAVFGPSDPARYAPSTANARVVRIDLPCSPCNRIRLPPARCVGHVPDCLDGITVEHVLAAAHGLLGDRS
jgi:lipopolysaccharide heptosyltransferase II